MEKLTEKQREVLNFLIKEVSNGNFPTYREIRDALGYSSVATVYAHVKRLEHLGYLRRDGRSRSLRPTLEGLQGFPLLGNVHAGAPTIAVEEILGFLPLPVDHRAHPNAFLLRVKGDSMVEGHIDDGDLVVVDPDIQPREGDVCVAIIGEESTVKKIQKIKNHLYLVPMNAKYKPIYIDRDISIIGKVIGLWRSKF